jgi:hypothetical protein
VRVQLRRAHAYADEQTRERRLGANAGVIASAGWIVGARLER